MEEQRPQFYKKKVETCEKIFSRQWLINYSLIILGATILAVGYSLFVVPKQTMDRGGTYILAKGLYYQEQDKKIIFTVLSRKEMVLLQTKVREIDHDAFLTVLDTREVIGSGFKPF